jgi:hypothetical protein
MANGSFLLHIHAATILSFAFWATRSRGVKVYRWLLGRLTVALVIGGGASWHAAVVLGAERNIKTSEHQTLLRVRAWIARALQRI